MAQETLVFRLDAAAGRDLEARLGSGAFDFRTVPHAAFSAVGEGVVVTLYRSGKLVVQGPSPDVFAARYLGDGARPAQAKPSASKSTGKGADSIAELEAGPLVGSDEAGKGDWFGPLVVAAVRLDTGDAQKLKKGGVADSKGLDDTRIQVMASALAGNFPHAIERLDPPDYNREHAETGNLNVILARMHARAIRRVAVPGVPVLVDRFANERVLARELGDLDAPLHQFPKGERATAVAAASILARNAFVEALDELSEKFGVDLAKGAGAPTDRAGRRFLQIHSRDRLGEVAKLHFKNTAKVVK